MVIIYLLQNYKKVSLSKGIEYISGSVALRQNTRGEKTYHKVKLDCTRNAIVSYQTLVQLVSRTNISKTKTEKKLCCLLLLSPV